MGATLLHRNLGLAVMLGAIAFDCASPAAAAFGGHDTAFHPAPHVFMHAPAHSSRPAIRHHVLARIRQFHHRPRGMTLPYGIYFDGSSGDGGPDASDASVSPEVILLPSPGTPPPATSEPPLDLSYVPGCRPIPNGYHCDVPRS